MSTAPITNEIRQNKKMLVKSMVFVCGLRAICCCHRLCRRRRRYRLSLSFAPSLGHGLTHYSVNITVHTKSVFMVRLANYDFCVNFLLFLFSFERIKTIWSDPFASHASAQIDCEYRFRMNWCGGGDCSPQYDSFNCLLRNEAEQNVCLVGALFRVLLWLPTFVSSYS